MQQESVVDGIKEDLCVSVFSKFSNTNESQGRHLDLWLKGQFRHSHPISEGLSQSPSSNESQLLNNEHPRRQQVRAQEAMFLSRILKTMIKFPTSSFIFGQW